MENDYSVMVKEGDSIEVMVRFNFEGDAEDGQTLGQLCETLISEIQTRYETGGNLSGSFKVEKIHAWNASGKQIARSE